VKVSAHAFVAGQAGTYQAAYCQAPPEPGTEPIPGYVSKACGYPESVHTMTPAHQAESDDALVERLVKQIGGWS
jgi:hypothetical protein